MPGARCSAISTTFATRPIGVIHMGLLNVIRRMALREKLPIREMVVSRKWWKLDGGVISG